MNQILSTELNWFKFQFGFSIFIVFLSIFFGILYYYDLIKKENISNDLIDNYSIYKLYATKNQEDNAIEENFNGLFRNH